MSIQSLCRAASPAPCLQESGGRGSRSCPWRRDASAIQSAGTAGAAGSGMKALREPIPRLCRRAREGGWRESRASEEAERGAVSRPPPPPLRCLRWGPAPPRRRVPSPQRSSPILPPSVPLPLPGSGSLPPRLLLLQAPFPPPRSLFPTPPPGSLPPPFLLQVPLPLRGPPHFLPSPSRRPFPSPLPVPSPSPLPPPSPRAGRRPLGFVLLGGRRRGPGAHLCLAGPRAPRCRAGAVGRSRAWLSPLVTAPLLLRCCALPPRPSPAGPAARLSAPAPQGASGCPRRPGGERRASGRGKRRQAASATCVWWSDTQLYILTSMHCQWVISCVVTSWFKWE